MNIVMISIGSTGDVKPYIHLGHALEKSGYNVTIVSFAYFEKMITQAHLKFVPLTGDVHSFMQEAVSSGVVGVQYLRSVCNTLKETAPIMVEEMWEACKDADCIIASYFGKIAQSVAEKKNIPFIQTQYFPMDKREDIPMSSVPMLKMGKYYNLLSYDLGYALISILEKYYLKAWREKHNMPKRKIEGQPKYFQNGHDIPVLFGVSPLIMPRSKYYKANMHVVGFLLNQNQNENNEPVSKELVDFINAEKEKPVYIGFGSMQGSQAKSTLNIVTEVINKTGIRAVISGGWAGIENVNNSLIHVCSFVNHEWLFSQVKAVVHHGGIGTVATGLRAGKPTLIIPFGGDQVIWGSRIETLGLGPAPIPIDKLTPETFEKALVDLLENKGYKVACEEMQPYLEKENGIENAVKCIKETLSEWYNID